MAGDLTDQGLSILMPSFDAGDYLQPAVASAVSQLGDGDELVIQDGGSRDGSIEALASTYRSDPRVKILVEPDHGQSDALQRALMRAVNPFIGWLNADDLYYPGALDVVRRALREQPDADVVYGSATIFGADDRIIRRGVPGEFTVRAFVRNGCHAFSGATFFRTDLVRDVGGFNPELHFTMDYDLFFRVAAKSRLAVQVPETLGGLRWHEASKSGTGAVKFFNEARRVRLGYAEGPRDRLRIYGQMGFRLAAVPLMPLRRTRAFSRLRRVKRF
jgi:glycosyltransferase involved in cell wall biosynthesis